MGRSSRQASVTTKRRAKQSSERVFRILANCGSPAEVFELYYWSREPGMIDLIRGIVAMPEETRAAFEAFIALAPDPRLIKGILNTSGELTLVSPDASKTIALAHYVAGNDADEAVWSVN